MKEDFIGYDLAVKLKEKGFEWDRITTYNPRTKVRNNHLEPTISQVLKWLREEKKIYIMIDRSFAMNNSWHYSICVDDDFDNIVQQASIANKSWEQSALDAIEYVIDNLI